ncbi:hypothetical protein ACGFW5_32295 [Streptomyces sp. NPDC048416]|uniref:hypothetical protein n=1 Tax=Streptomyces sp. NPDC048416 TaxID=3365546 RepID=UPI00371E6BC5
MRNHRTTTAAAALAAAGALLLTGCGGGSKGGDSKKIAGADSTSSASATPSASASAPADAADRPKIVMPADVKHVYEGGKTGDPVKDAVLADNAQNLEAIDTAITGDQASTESALKYYNKDKALIAAADYIKSYYVENRSFAGTTRYYHRNVTVSGESAALSYCADATQTYPKDRKTGKVDRSVPGSASDYTFFTEQLQKNDKGVWQSVNVTSGPGGTKCM